jgi:nucleolar GTP-binding protein
MSSTSNAPNFKAVTPVLASMALVDRCLNQTNRKTPTVIHPSYPIARIRAFYMVKVKYCAETFGERLKRIVAEFPQIDTLHPFFADLFNVMYNKDHYKLALGQINVCRSLIENLGSEYVRLLKFADSAYRCKQLKIAAFGRMATLVKRQRASFDYLEKVRQHMARLPTIEPTGRNLVMTGFPSSGKSSFVNRISRADVEVASFAFTTRSLFVGHFDSRFIRWSVIDSPGVLDHPLDQRNPIEMLAITALAHLRAAVLFVFDGAENSDYTLEAQVALFKSLSPLFAGKPVTLLLNKADIFAPNGELWQEALAEDKVNVLLELRDELRAAIAAGSSAAPSSLVGNDYFAVSTVTGQGIDEAKHASCDALLAERVERKLRSARRSDALKSVHVAQPQPRDNKARPAIIPAGLKVLPASRDDGRIPEGIPMSDKQKPDVSSLADREDRVLASVLMGRKVPREKTVADLMVEWDGEGPIPGFDDPMWRNQWKLANDEWRHDVIPEIWEGKNIADFVDPDIAEKLERLEAEEAERLATLAIAEAGEDGSDEEVEPLSAAEKQLLRELHARKAQVSYVSQAKQSANTNSAHLPRTSQRASLRLTGGIMRTPSLLKAHLEDLAVNPDAADRAADESYRPRGRSRGPETVAAASRSHAISGAKRSRSASRSRGVSQSRGAETGVRGGGGVVTRDPRARSRSVSRSAGRALERAPTLERARGDVYSDVLQKRNAQKRRRLADKATLGVGKFGKRGESDRWIGTEMPKHLFTGKRGIGKTDRR